MHWNQHFGNLSNTSVFEIQIAVNNFIDGFHICAEISSVTCLNIYIYIYGIEIHIKSIINKFIQFNELLRGSHSCNFLCI